MNSLTAFFQNDVLKFSNLASESQIIDSGSGMHSIFEDFKIKGKIKAIDKNIQNKKSGNIEYLRGDIVFQLQLIDSSSVDLIFDSHLIHCLTDLNIRKKYLLEVCRLLSVDGVFAFQSMIKKRNSDPYDLFKDRILFSSFEVENELLDLGLQIKLFKIIPNLEYLDDFSKNYSCDLVRCICSKK